MAFRVRPALLALLLPAVTVACTIVTVGTPSAAPGSTPTPTPSPAPGFPADGSSGCIVEVTTDTLNVRAEPDQNSRLIGQVPRGARIDALRTVENGFRQLEDLAWASEQYLQPVDGTDCG
jgi:hypothetical protein